MCERYTEQARRSIFFAWREAGNFGSPYVESEHLLLGLMHDSRRILQRSACANPDGIRKEIEDLAPPAANHVPQSVDLPISSSLKRALGYSAEEAERLNQPLIDTHHLLLGLLREKDSFVPDLLHKYGITPEAVLSAVVPEIPG